MKNLKKFLLGAMPPVHLVSMIHKKILKNLKMMVLIMAPQVTRKTEKLLMKILLAPKVLVIFQQINKMKLLMN